MGWGEGKFRAACREAAEWYRHAGWHARGNAALLNVTPVGNVVLTFSEANNASMRYTVAAVSDTNAIARLVLGSAPA